MKIEKLLLDNNFRTRKANTVDFINVSRALRYNLFVRFEYAAD